MNAGTLDRRVAIQAAVDTQDGTTGEPVRSWLTIATVWARIEPQRGSEGVTDGGVLAQVATKITIRYARALADLSAKHRIVHGSTIYNIVTPIDVNLSHRKIELTCTSGLNEG